MNFNLTNLNRNYLSFSFSLTFYKKSWTLLREESLFVEAPSHLYYCSGESIIFLFLHLIGVTLSEFKRILFYSSNLFGFSLVLSHNFLNTFLVKCFDILLFLLFEDVRVEDSNWSSKCRIEKVFDSKFCSFL